MTARGKKAVTPQADRESGTQRKAPPAVDSCYELARQAARRQIAMLTEIRARLADLHASTYDLNFGMQKAYLAELGRLLGQADALRKASRAASNTLDKAGE